MKKFLTLFFTIFFVQGLIAQTIYVEKTLPSAVQTISNYQTQVYVGGLNGIYYFDRPYLEFNKKNGIPLVKVSPLGTEAIFLADRKIIKYDAISFTTIDIDKNKIKNKQFTSIISDEDGTFYYVSSLEGDLFSLDASQKDLILKPVPLDFFVSQIYWHENLNKILVADDYYLQYYDPVSKITSQKIKLDSDITAVNAHERKFLVTAGLSNGNLVVLNQNLDKIIYEIEISKASLTSIVEDPVDHYLYIGDANGTVFTYDLLKKEVVKKEDHHSGSIKMGSVYEPLSNKKYIMTIGSDDMLKVLSTTDLTPNYIRILEDRVKRVKEKFLSIKDGESAVSYDRRVNQTNINNLIEKTKIKLIDSIARTKLTGIENYKVVDQNLIVDLDPFTPIKIKLFKNVKDINTLNISESHFILNRDNSFAIRSLTVKNDFKQNSSETPIKFSSNSKIMQSFEEEISLDLSKEIARKEAGFKTSLNDVVSNMRSEGKLNDVDLTVTSALKREKDSLGNDELNLHLTFLSQGIRAEAQKETADYPSGKYDIFDSEAATTLVGFFIKSIEDKLSEYLTDGRRVTFKITGATDKSGIKSSLPYNNEYGSFKNFPYYFQGQLSGLVLDKVSGIKNNSQLGFLRTYAVRSFIEKNSDVFENTKRKYIHYSEEADAYGREHRKIKIVVIIHKIVPLAQNTNSSDIKISDVDVNIPKGPNTPGYALVIGNEDYSSFQRNIQKESNVPFAIRDGEVFKEYLNQMYGMPKENIDFLKNATLGEMTQAISRLERLMDLDGKGKDIVVFYSGHGMPEEKTKEPYLIPVDINGNNVSQGIALKDLMSRLSKKPHNKISFIIDACFSGLGKNEPLVSLKGVTVKAKNPELGDNMLLISSSSGTESSVVDKDNQHGLFTYHLMKILKETKGDISIQDLYNRLRKDVAINAIRKLDKVQTPSILLGKSFKNKSDSFKIIGK